MKIKKLLAKSKVLRRVKKVYSSFRERYYMHTLKSHASYLINYYKLLYTSYLSNNKSIVAISLIEHIGDIIANEPVSREVRKKYPDAKIIWFVRKPYRELLIHNPNIDKVLIVYCLTTWIRIQDKFKFKVIYDLHFNERSCKFCNKPLRKENVNNSINGTNYFNYGSLLKAFCLHNKIEISETTPQIYFPEKINNSKFLIPEKNYVIIHGSSNEAIKDWSHDKWNLLVTDIINKIKYHVIEIGTVNIINTDSGFYHNLCGKLSLLQSAAAIKNANLFIGIDSGPAHMANATGTPGIILLGEYYFGMKNYNPFEGNYGSLKKCRLVYSDSSVKNISVENVIENCVSLLGETTSSL